MFTRIKRVEDMAKQLMEGGAILNRKDAGLLQASVDKGDQIDRLADRIIKCEQQIFILLRLWPKTG